MIEVFNGISPTLERNVYVADSAVVIGDVVLGEDVSVWPATVIRGDVNAIRVGRETNIQDGCVLHVTQPTPARPEGHRLLVGNGVTIGHRVVLHGCTIGDLCLIGIGAIVMDGAVVEDRVMIGAGALVPPGKHLDSGFLYVGSPARQARPLTEAEQAFFETSRDGYVRLKQRYAAGPRSSDGTVHC